MAILVTGGSGFLGSALTQRLLEKGHRVYSLSRHPPAPRDNLIPVVGDVTQENLGLETVPRDIVSIHHLAAAHRLGDDPDGSIWRTNVEGTSNAIKFCIRNDIGHLYFTSTAYTMGRNPYERSKALCELIVTNSDAPRVTIFKPSILMGTAEHPYPGHFSQFISLLVKVLHGAGLLKKSVEEKLGLPILQFALRIKGNPEGTLNLITVDAVAAAMATIEAEGTFWLTHPNPPKLKDLVKWVGEFIQFDFSIMPEFKPRPLEAQFMKMVSAFKPYLEGDNFPSHITGCPLITKEFIHQTFLDSIA